MLYCRTQLALSEVSGSQVPSIGSDACGLLHLFFPLYHFALVVSGFNRFGLEKLKGELGVNGVHVSCTACWYTRGNKTRVAKYEQSPQK
jgi:hypothetical protein